MSQIVFLVEEASMREVLESLLPKLLSKHEYLILAHEGKSDLDKSIPRKLRAWQTPNTYFVVLRDNDNKNCLELKANLKRLCDDAGRPDTLIRIVCQELEAWFLGDLQAVGDAYEEPTIPTVYGTKAKYRTPDRVSKPSDDLAKMTKDRGKVGRARRIAAHLDVERNRSHSFQTFVNGLIRLTTTISNSSNTQAIASVATDPTP